MELKLKPGDEIYEHVKYLIDNKQVKLNMFKELFFTRGNENFKRLETYHDLYGKGFLELEEQKKFKRLKVFSDLKTTSTFSPGRYEVLEDKTIILYDKLHDKS